MNRCRFFSLIFGSTNNVCSMKMFGFAPLLGSHNQFFDRVAIVLSKSVANNSQTFAQFSQIVAFCHSLWPTLKGQRGFQRLSTNRASCWVTCVPAGAERALASGKRVRVRLSFLPARLDVFENLLNLLV